MKKFQPVIKWTGSKRSQAFEIIRYFPESIDTYYEPFCGGCSVLRTLLSSNIKVRQYVCSDINQDLINLWNEIKENPNEVSQHYNYLWKELNKDSNIDRKRSFFESIRKRYNNEHSSLDFMFIMRTCINGMPRYNSKGDFNNSFHLTRNGIVPESLDSIIKEWSFYLNRFDVRFICQSYENIKPSENDFIYCDPPYANTDAIYFGGINIEEIFEWLSNLSCSYAFSFNGKVKNIDMTYVIPKKLYSQHIYLKSGISRIFRKIKDNVFESLYIKNYRNVEDSNNLDELF